MNCTNLACARRLWGVLLSLVILAPTAPAAVGAENAPSCDKVRAPKGDYVEVANADLMPVRGDVLDIGEIDFTKTRSIRNAWYVVSAPRVSVQTGLGGEEFRAVLETDGRVCAKARIASLSLEFDGSSLAPGRFEQPLSIFREDAAKPSLEAKVRKVTGFVKRVWIDARSEPVSSKSGSAYRVRVTNSGNVPSGVLRLIANENRAIEIRNNGCDGRVLAPSEGCDIEAVLAVDRVGDARLSYEVPIGMAGLAVVENTLWLNVRDRRLQAFTTNR